MKNNMSNVRLQNITWANIFVGMALISQTLPLLDQRVY